MKKGKKLSIVLACSITALVLLVIGICVYLGHDPHKGFVQFLHLKSESGRGVVIDRNGKLLITNDSLTYSDSSGSPIWEYIGKYGVEKSYGKVLRGENDKQGKNLKLSIDYELQKLGENLLDGQTGSIVALEPSTGEVLCMASSPSDRLRLNRCIAGMFPPGGLFRVAHGLVFLSEGIVDLQTKHPCNKGFFRDGIEIGCHPHISPVTIREAIENGCDTYFCQGFLDMMDSKTYDSVSSAFTRWREYMNSFGFGYRLGIDIPGEKRGIITTSEYYDKVYRGVWKGQTIITNAIGQGEMCVTPLQMANLCAIIANRGNYITPHVVKEIQGDKLSEEYTSTKSTLTESKVFDEMASIMRSNVINGNCKMLSNFPIEICGVSGDASFKEHDYNAFIGFAPMDTPRIAVVVHLETKDNKAASIGGLVMEKYLTGKISQSREN